MHNIVDLCALRAHQAGFIILSLQAPAEGGLSALVGGYERMDPPVDLHKGPALLRSHCMGLGQGEGLHSSVEVGSWLASPRHSLGLGNSSDAPALSARRAVFQ